MRITANQLCLIVAFCVSHLIYSQVNDNFSDSNFTSNPTWNGDTSKFDISSNELWLNAPPLTDVAFLTTPSLVLPNGSWEFFSRMVFNPSSANYCRFYLASDQSNLNSTTINGYYVELGRINDEISLYKVVNGAATRIIDGPDGMLNFLTCPSRVRVTHTAGVWNLMVDSTGAYNFVSIGTVNDASISTTYFSGMYCRYTSTRSDKFYFDDIIISGGSVADNTPPQILSHSAVGNILTLGFNEPVDPANLVPSNFTLNNGLTVISVMQDNMDSRKIHITASSAFSMDVFYNLTINSLQDLFGNFFGSVVYPFVLHVPVQGNVIINEIMADPSPQVGLPELEWIEIRNNSVYPIPLLNWKLKVNTAVRTFPSYTIQPGEYVLVMNSPDTSYFGIGGLHKIGISGFPSLINTGATIQLLDTSGVIIDDVDYSIAWYKDPVKDDGGYTLERINPFDICMAGSNWMASMSPNGGTPAAINSVFDTTQVPVQVTSEVIDSLNVLLIFNKWMNPSTYILSNFNLPGINSIHVLTDDSVILSLNTPLQINAPLYLTVLQGIQDCRGINIPDSIRVPVINYQPGLFDILITELMIDETPVILLPAAEYIELKNTLNFPVKTLGWKLVVNGYNYMLGNHIIPPDSFLVLTHTSNVSLFNGINIAGVNSLGLTNDGGRVELYHSSGLLYHAVPYNIDFYDVDAKDDGGWSLEMIDLTRPCIFNRNWTASSNLNGGSPGINNSSSLQLQDVQKPHLIKTGLPANDTVILYFDEPVLNVHPSALFISNGMAAQNIQYSSPLLNEYTLSLQNSFSNGMVYHIKPNGITDCEGNVIVADSVPVSIPEAPVNSDIIINEILFDPLSNCIDYVEIYNRSDKAIDLSRLIIGEGDTINLLLHSYSSVHTKSVLLHPSEYLMISTDHEKVQSCYIMQDTSAWWDVSYLPDFTNTSGTVGISTMNQQNLDMFAYSDQMHFSILNSVDGISLERLRFDDPTNNSMNWHSAASTTGFGTPGYKNSQASPGIMISDDFTIDPPIFSPDNDGYQDYVTISYNVASSGYIISVRVFDQAGRLEKFLVNNELIGTSGTFTWDGTNDAGGKVNLGIHIVYFELIGINGDILHFKKPVVVATKI